MTKFIGQILGSSLRLIINEKTLWVTFNKETGLFMTNEEPVIKAMRAIKNPTFEEVKEKKVKK